MAPRPPRSRSIPASYRYRRPKLAKPDLLCRMTKFRQRAGALLGRHRKPVATGLTGLACAYVAHNLWAWAHQEPSPLVTQYPRYPQWMHTRNAYTVLGMNEPAAPAWVPPLTQVRAAKRRVALWHPDKWKVNRLSNQKEGERIYAVINEALERFDAYWANPQAAIGKQNSESGGLLNPVNSTLAHFSNHEADRHGVWGMLLDTVKAGSMPPYKHAKAPQTVEAAARFYPNDWSSALRALNPFPIPPLGIDRYHACDYTSATNNPLVRLVRACDRLFGASPGVWSDAKKTRLDQWLVEGDFSSWKMERCGSLTPADYVEPCEPEDDVFECIRKAAEWQKANRKAKQSWFFWVMNLWVR